MEGYVMGRKRLTPTIVGKIASKRFVVVNLWNCFIGCFQDNIFHFIPKFIRDLVFNYQS